MIRNQQVLGSSPSAGSNTVNNLETYGPRLDIVEIARHLRVDADIIFGRLYYYLDQKYGYKNTDDGSHVPFFSLGVGKDRHCVHFPLLASVLASMRVEWRRDSWAVGLAVVSLIVSIVSVAISVLRPS